MLFNAHLCNHILLQVVVGPGAQLCTLLEVWILGDGMSTFVAQSAVRRGSGAPSADGPGACQHLIGPDFPSIENRQSDRGFQIGMFRSIRVDHTNCLQVPIQTHSFSRICRRQREVRSTLVAFIPYT
jgi:hypothetical protein